MDATTHRHYVDNKKRVRLIQVNKSLISSLNLNQKTKYQLKQKQCDGNRVCELCFQYIKQQFSSLRISFFYFSFTNLIELYRIAYLRLKHSNTNVSINVLNKCIQFLLLLISFGVRFLFAVFSKTISIAIQLFTCILWRVKIISKVITRMHTG